MENIITKLESSNREDLRKSKPKVLEKILAQDELIRNNKSVALIVLNYEYICNFTCEHCSSDGLMIKNAKDRRESKKRRHLTPPFVKTLFDQADKLGLTHVAISGGEPLTFPDFDQVIEAIGPDRFWIATDTNGWTLDKKAPHLKEIGVDKVQISLDSFIREEHDEFRNKKGSYDRIMTAIDTSISAGLNVLLLTVITKERVYSSEFIDYLEFAKSKNITVYVTLAKPIGAWAGNLEVVCGDKEIAHLKMIAETYNIVTRFWGGYGIDLGCIAVKRSITITKYGDVMPCPYIQTSLGNVFDEPLAVILERGLDLVHFSYGEKRTCLSGNKDHEFVQKYMPRIWKNDEPTPYQEVFGLEDFTDKEKGKKWLDSASRSIKLVSI